MSEYVLEMTVDGKTTRTMLDAMPSSLVLKLFRVDKTETTTKIAEQVIL